MEPEGSLPCSQEPATGPYTETDECSPYAHILFPYDYSLIYAEVSQVIALL
jgi:hypothetical protein